MKAVFSDAHGNLEALRAVLADVTEQHVTFPSWSQEPIQQPQEGPPGVPAPRGGPHPSRAAWTAV
jgi:hypothetical protein